MLKMKAFVVILLVSVIQAKDTCKSYMDYIKPLLETNNVTGLREYFKYVNTDQNVVTPYTLFTLEATVLADTHYMNMLISLSKPYLEKMNTTDVWPENNNAPMPFIGKICEKDSSGETICSDGGSTFNRHFNPTNSYHAGIRYVHSCRVIQKKTCFKQTCKYNPDEPIVKTQHKNIYVPIENFIMGDGSAVADHVTEGVDEYVMKGLKNLEVRECFARQIFFSPTEDGCYNSTEFFSLAETLSLGPNGRERDGIVPWFDFMSPKHDYFVLLT